MIQEQEYAEAEWLLRFPMTKAGVRALDTLEDYVPKVNGDGPMPTRDKKIQKKHKKRAGVIKR